MSVLTFHLSGDGISLLFTTVYAVVAILQLSRFSLVFLNPLSIQALGLQMHSAASALYGV